MLRIMALDIGTVTAWAVNKSLSPSGRPYSQVVRHRSTSHGALGCEFNGWFSDALAAFSPDVVAYETPVIGPHMDANSVGRLFGIGFLIETICHIREIHIERAHNQTIKKFFAGHGHAKKPDMVAAAAARGWHVECPDEADALACLTWAMDRHGAEIEPYRREAA